MIGTGADGALPLMKEIHEQARRRVDLVSLPTEQAISVLAKTTNTILHLTCSPASAATASTAAVAYLLLCAAAHLLAAGVRLAP